MGESSEFRAWWSQGIAPRGLQQMRMCPLGHTARHITTSLRDGTLSRLRLEGGEGIVPGPA
jgi:hypothetical protein